MFNLGDLMDMFEGNDNEQNRNRRNAKGQHNNMSPFAFSRHDDEEDDDDDNHRQRHASNRRRRDNDDDESPFDGLLG